MFINVKIKPRWIARALAYLLGYCWRRCPLCRDFYAGFEWGGIYFDNTRTIHAVCPNCANKPGVYDRPPEWIGEKVKNR